MTIRTHLSTLTEDMIQWRRHLHAHPETGFEEYDTSVFVAEKLSSFGIEVERGLGGTGVVGSLCRGNGPAIGLRADMDALDMEEANDVPYKSRRPGKMHACGHDGHTTMLLGAAAMLSASDRFHGTVHFIFQPAEEGLGGAARMIEDGLFERFPMEAVYGMHNRPGMPVGQFGVPVGPVMAAAGLIEITITGKGSHAAMPHLGIDTVLVAAETISALQAIVSREVDPLSSAVISVTQIKAGDSWNVIPETVTLRGTVRFLTREVGAQLRSAIERVAMGVASAHDATASVRYEEKFAPTINHGAQAEFAARIAEGLVGVDKVDRTLAPSMGSEDFSSMLERRPGAYLLIGAGPTDGGRVLHGVRYDFNDEILDLGAQFWTKLVEEALPT